MNKDTSNKYGAFIQKAREEKKQKSAKSKNDVIEEEKVNLSIKVPRSLRQHWAAEAKRNGITLTAAITEALIEQFGKPS